MDNFNRPVHFLKFADQIYVQTWHGDRGFKKILYDMNDGLKYPDYAQMDLAVSGSDFGTKNYRSAFRYADMPRCAVIVTVLLAILVAISVFQFFALGDNEARAAKRAARKLARGGVAV